MKVWWMAAISMMLASTAVHAGQLAGEQPIKDTDGTTIAVLTVCSDCQSEAGKSCSSGAEAGWLAGKPCGKCLIQRNYGEAVNYPYDLQITGTLTDPDGQPVKDRFVKAFLPNGWTIRARTSEKGAFRLMLGATTDRKSREPLVTDLGAHIDKQKGDNPYYAIFLLPPSYKPCAADAMTSPGPKPSDRVKPKAKKK